MKSNSYELQDLVIGRDGAALTPPISMRIEGGEMLLVRGANGSGKSTLLKIMAGLLAPHAGQFIVTHKGEPHHPLYLGHKRGLTPSMSVYDNVAFWAKAAGFRELIPAAIHYFDLDDVADAPLGTLSAGWQQRVMLTRLITMQATLWLLDEPIAHLDTEGTALLQSLAQSRLEQGGMIVMTTHTEIQGNMVKTLNLSELNETLKVSA